MSSLLGRPQRVGALRVKLPHPYRALLQLLLACILVVGSAVLYGLLMDVPGLNGHATLKKVIPWIITVAGIAAVGVLLFLVRRAIQAVTAARPGGIEISVVSAHSGDGAMTDLIATGLREALTEVHLSGPSVVPGESAPQDFLTDVRAVVAGAGTSGAFLAGAL